MNWELILAAAIKYGPEVGEMVHGWFSNSSKPTDEEWKALIAKMKEAEQKSYFDYVKDSQLNNG